MTSKKIKKRIISLFSQGTSRQNTWKLKKTNLATNLFKNYKFSTGLIKTPKIRLPFGNKASCFPCANYIHHLAILHRKKWSTMVKEQLLSISSNFPIMNYMFSYIETDKCATEALEHHFWKLKSLALKIGMDYIAKIIWNWVIYQCRIWNCQLLLY